MSSSRTIRRIRHRFRQAKAKCAEHFRAAFSFASPLADVIIMDCAPGLSNATAAALKLANKVVVPFRPDAVSEFAVDRISQIIEGRGYDDVQANTCCGTTLCLSRQLCTARRARCHLYRYHRRQPPDARNPHSRHAGCCRCVRLSSANRNRLKKSMVTPSAHCVSFTVNCLVCIGL